MYPDFPHILFFSEHHLKNFELDQINVDGYNLGATYCRQIVKRGVQFISQYLFKDIFY